MDTTVLTEADLKRIEGTVEGMILRREEVKASEQRAKDNVVYGFLVGFGAGVAAYAIFHILIGLLS